MDITRPGESEGFRSRIIEFLAQHLPPGWRGLGGIEDREEADRFVETWRQTLAENGLLGVTWPVQYGGAGLSKLEQVLLVEEFAKVGVPAMGYNDTFSIKMVGNTLLLWGTEEQKMYFLPRILSGEAKFCQGYSEPDAGSDLAGLATRATLDGDRWVINGQKTWTSRAREANWIFLLVRTDRSAARHKGITFLLVPLEQPGIEIRPITMLSGEREFNETFFTDATTAQENVVGRINEGWSVAMTLLGHERGEEAATNPILFRAELDRLMAMARDRGLSKNPVVRQKLAQAYVRCEIMRFLGYRVLTGVLSGRDAPGPEASISKLYWSEYHQFATSVALDVLGMSATVMEGRGPLRAYRTDDPGAPSTSGSWVGSWYNAAAGTIYAGTSEVQRNILGESVLRLPKGPT
jgi:alkylation response protein AidB-like acyl-CoA dehydrogenase